MTPKKELRYLQEVKQSLKIEIEQKERTLKDLRRELRKISAKISRLNKRRKSKNA